MNPSRLHDGDQRSGDPPLGIVYIEDNPLDAELVRRVLEIEFPGCRVETVATRAEFLAALKPGPPDLVLSDFNLPGWSGIETLALAREHIPHIPFIFLSGTIGEELAISTLRAGASDYVLKNSLARLPLVIRRALDEAHLRRVRDADERRLRELTGIIERASEAIVVSDLAGRITLWNDGAARLYGLPAAEAVGQTSEQIFTGTELSHVRDAREATLETGDWRREVSVKTRDGRDIVVDVHITLVRDAAGHPSARLSIATDITEKKKLQDRALRTQRLESLGQLAAGIAHDLNNVLTPIGMAATLLRQRATDPRDLHILDILEKGASRGVGLVRQILGFARGVGGEPRISEPRLLVEEVCDVIRASFPKSIQIDAKLPDDLWTIRVNATQIHQVLLNLVVNARDAMTPGSGTLRLRAENCVLDKQDSQAIEGARTGRFVVVEVSDTGTGIAPEVLARIWEPFFTTKSEGNGTGLGLSTVRGIVAGHGGFVTVATKAGVGTTFRVFLPASDGRPDGRPGSKLPSPPPCETPSGGPRPKGHWDARPAAGNQLIDFGAFQMGFVCWP